MFSLQRTGHPFPIRCDRLDLMTGVLSMLAWRGRMRRERAYISPLSYAPVLVRSGVLIVGGLLGPSTTPVNFRLFGCRVAHASYVASCASVSGVMTCLVWLAVAQVFPVLSACALVVL
jgi:hypothetical protein